MNINLQKYLKLDNSKYIIVGVSTGPDSMALLHYLKYNCNKDIVCCHINHNVRKQSKKEALYLKKYCLDNNIIFETMTITEYKENNFENEARTKRYHFYEETMSKYNSKLLFLAHHGDDLIETILMKIVRGSNLEGYLGIKEISYVKDYYIIRPLLKYTKNDLINYNRKNNVKYYIDKSNKNTNYTRNRYRKYILPFLKKENSDVHKYFLRYSNCLFEYDNYIKEEVKLKIKQFYHNNTLELTEFKDLNKFIIKNVIYEILKDVYNNKTNTIKEKHITDIMDLITNNKPNLYIDLPDNIKVTKKYDIVTFKKKEDNKNDYKIKLKDNITIDNHIISIIKDDNNDGNDICRLNSKELKLPLYIRNKKNKDTIYVKGLNGSKKVKDIFIDEKIPLDKRKRYPLLVDNEDNILWIPNIKKSNFNKKINEKYDIILRYCEKEENYE